MAITGDNMLKRQFPGKRVLRESGWSFKSAEGVESVPGPDPMLIEEEDYQRSVCSGGYFEGRPIFVVEVVSPSERKSRRLQKIGLYLEAGTGSVVEVDYTKRTVLVNRPEEDAPEPIHRRIERPFTAEFTEIFARL